MSRDQGPICPGESTTVLTSALTWTAEVAELAQEPRGAQQQRISPQPHVEPRQPLLSGLQHARRRHDTPLRGRAHRRHRRRQPLHLDARTERDSPLTSATT